MAEDKVDYSSAKAFVTTKPDELGPTPPKYNRGDRVRLVELHDSVPAEEGVVLSADWHDCGSEKGYMYVVEVDAKYRAERFDDGLRECDEIQIVEKLS